MKVGTHTNYILGWLCCSIDAMPFCSGLSSVKQSLRKLYTRGGCSFKCWCIHVHRLVQCYHASTFGST